MNYANNTFHVFPYSPLVVVVFLCHIGTSAVSNLTLTQASYPYNSPQSIHGVL